jgi:hypothetical protein
MKRWLRTPSPALVISLIALFVALGGTAYASGLISGGRIENHSIPAKKLTKSAIAYLHGQRGPTGPPGPKGATGPKGPPGPGAISILKGGVPADDQYHLLTTIDGLDVRYDCNSSPGVTLVLGRQSSADTVFASGDAASDGTLTSIQKAAPTIGSTGTNTANLDVIAWAGSVGRISRFDLGGYNSGTACNIWGLITPGS